MKLSFIAMATFVFVGVFSPPAQQELAKRSEWFSKDRFSQFLVKWNEPPACADSTGAESDYYRFVWTHALSGEIVIVRVDVLSDGSGKLKYHRIERSRTDKETIKQKDISKRDVERLLASIEQAGFWRLPTQPDIVGCDGEDWTMEGFAKGRCHIVSRWSPRKGPYKKLGHKFLSLP